MTAFGTKQTFIFLPQYSDMKKTNLQKIIIFIRLTISLSAIFIVIKSLFVLPYNMNQYDFGIVVVGLLILFFTAYTKSNQILAFSFLSGLASLGGVVIFIMRYVSILEKFRRI